MSTTISFISTDGMLPIPEDRVHSMQTPMQHSSMPYIHMLQENTHVCVCVHARVCVRER
eukprot:c45480_g1_i1 orf=122-298(+)